MSRALKRLRAHGLIKKNAQQGTPTGPVDSVLRSQFAPGIDDQIEFDASRTGAVAAV